MWHQFTSRTRATELHSIDETNLCLRKRQNNFNQHEQICLQSFSLILLHKLPK